MTVSDYIINTLEKQKIKEVFLVTGGAIAFLVDALHNRKNIRYICMQHEQSAAMAAEAYSRLGPGLGVAMATSGPGATNLITGICCAWFDSIPTLYITGQVNTNEQIGDRKVRQIGFQEANIVDIVKPITKFSEKLENAEDIGYLMDKAIKIAKSGRPGPVLLDIPVNLQYATYEKNYFRKYQLSKVPQKINLEIKIKEIINLVSHSKRPILLLGFGIHLAKAENELIKLVNSLKIPIITTWSGLDLIPFNNPLRVGQSGIYGDRAANFAVQNCDLLLSIGARLDTRNTGDPKHYARGAKKIIVDIDPAEINKNRGLQADIGLAIDAKEFLTKLISFSKKIELQDIRPWLKIIKDWKYKYPTYKQQSSKNKKNVNAYAFGYVLSQHLSKEAVVIPDIGSNSAWTIQGIRLKKGQRFFSAFGNAPMGYALPASIGASMALKNTKPVICIIGDGGLQINIQELQTIIHHKLPIKIFVLNNKCYGIIKQFQDTWLGSRYEASQKGYSTPDFIKVSKAYGFKTYTIRNDFELHRKIKQVLDYQGSVFCDVLINTNQKILPKVEFGLPIEDMTPYLKRSELIENMIVKPLSQSVNLKK